MELPSSIRDRFRDFGRAGGEARARRLSPERRAQIARRAAVTRWTRDRFGAGSFAELGVPGGELIDDGLEAAVEGRESVEGLLIAITAPRLRREGVPVPAFDPADPELRCYRLVEELHGGLAHARYLALLGEVESFADACGLLRRHGGRVTREAP